PFCETRCRRDDPADRPKSPIQSFGRRRSWHCFLGLRKNLVQSRNPVGIALIRLAVAILERMRSLLIISGEERMSRSCRPTVKSPSLRYPDRPQARIACITVETASSEASTFSRLIEDWK